MRLTTLLITTLFMSCLAQDRIKNTASTATVCWDSEVQGAKYIVLQRKYPSTGGQWSVIGVTTATSIDINRPAYDSFELGVRTVLGTDTSGIHSSLDITACKQSTDCETCDGDGPWYIYWAVGAPIRVRLVQEVE